MRPNILFTTGLLLVGTMLVGGLFAPVLAPFSPTQLNLDAVLAPPSLQHLMGTDSLGRDVFSRMLYGARVSMLVGFVAVGIATILGVFFGALAGFYGKVTDTVVMRFVDLMLCFPTFFLILAVIAMLDPSLVNIMMVIGLTSWMGVARLVRADFMKLRDQPFVLAARAQGLSDWQIISRHLLPNALPPVLISATLGVAGAILVESSLSFLGIGIQPPDASWGNILTEGKAYVQFAWWLSLFPGLAILLTVLGYNLLGEGLRDALDPHKNNVNL
jgi:peptide/nickel transport system permease protein